MSTAIVWFRRDLRIADQPAVRAALEKSDKVHFVFIWSPEDESLGSASRWWLHYSLLALHQSLEKTYGVQLELFRGKPAAILEDLISKSQAQFLYWSRLYDPQTRKRDEKIKEHFKKKGLEVKSFNASLLFEPTMIANKSGKPFQVFSPFWRHCLASGPIESARAAVSKKLVASKSLSSLSLRDLGLLPKIKWDKKMAEVWRPGELGAQERLAVFLKAAVKSYSTDRNIPGVEGSSRLSPHLHFGEISPHQIWNSTSSIINSSGNSSRVRASSVAKNSAEVFLREIGWREFAYHLLYHFPHTPDEPLRAEFKKFPWRKSKEDFEAWTKGRTGYPIVDAGMRELWATGWMHNRVRMVVASFLVKHLLIEWQKGAAWFLDTLVDADLASNTLGWQWASGSGADAAPYFRIFNPILQGEKFDPDGAYVRRWVPELADLSNKFIHKPWLLENSPALYPAPIVDHAFARKRALQAFAQLRLNDSLLQ